MALMSGTVEQVGRSVVVPKTPLLPNNSLNQTRPLLSAYVMIRQIASDACSQVGARARRLAQKGCVANAQQRKKIERKFMKLIIAASTPQAKGALLEKLTAQILRSQNFHNISTNHIAAGGNEIDVRADYEIVMGRSVTSIPVLCECKAYKSPLDMNHWLKFVGKVSTEAKKHDNVMGFLIALSGLNGNVSGAYHDYSIGSNNITVLKDDDLLDIVSSIYHPIDISESADYANRYSAAPYKSIDLCLHEDGLFWCVTFSNKTFTLINARNRFRTIKEEIGLNVSRENNLEYFDFMKGSQSAWAAILIMNLLFSIVFEFENKIAHEELCQQCYECLDEEGYKVSLSEIIDSVDYFIEKNIFTQVDNYVSIDFCFDTDAHGFQKTSELLLQVLNGKLYFPSMASQFYKNVIEHLWNCVKLERSHLIHLIEDEQGIKNLLLASPTALKVFLKRLSDDFSFVNPIRSKEQLSEAGLDDNMQRELNEIRRNDLMSELHYSLEKDFLSSEVNPHILLTAGIVEFDKSIIYKFKTQDEVIIDFEGHSRFINKLTVNSEGDEAHITTIKVAPTMPEPWEMDGYKDSLIKRELVYEEE